MPIMRQRLRDIMSLEIGWKKLLEDNFYKFDPDPSHELDDMLYIDINGNGFEDPNEVLDDMTTDADHEPYYVDEAEAKAFCIANRDAIADKIEFLKFGKNFLFTEDNPIHSLILYEYQLLEPYYNGGTRELVLKAYSNLATIRYLVLEYQMKWIKENSSEPDSRIKMLWVRQAMQDSGILFDLGGSILFIENLSTQRKVFDCISTFVLIAVAYEFHWEVNAFLVPNHVGARWDNVESGNFEVPSGEHFDNDFYIHYGLDQRGEIDGSARRHGRRIEQVSIDNGVYLRTLNNTELEGIFFFNIGQAISLMTSLFGNQFESAVDAYDESLRRLPQNAMAVAGRGLAEIELGQWDEALTDFIAATQLDPNLAIAYEGLGKVYLETGNYESAITSLDTAISLQETVSARINRGVSEFRLALATEDSPQKRHLLREALRDYRRALQLDPGNEAAKFNIEVIQSILD